MTASARDARLASVHLGLAANWRQFTLLVVINGFVGSMVGLERATLPLVAKSDFGIASATAALSFIVVFGLTKALTNLVAGHLVNRVGRRMVLVGGWVIALPVPLLILWAPNWAWVVAANALLGISQGLTWSTTVIMKIDLAGPERRGLAMGLNEFAGYAAVAAATLVSGAVATTYGLRAGPAYLGIAIAAIGLTLSALFARDTMEHVAAEQSRADTELRTKPRPLASIVRASLWSDRRLFSVSQAGLVNNLNDGLAWGVFPLLFATSGFDVATIGALAAIYPGVWGVSQLLTGPLSDRWGRAPLIVSGMLLQGVALVGIAFTRSIAGWVVALSLLGVGTALVYPTLLAAVGDIVPPSSRATTVGVYRLWRDLGYVAGAVLAGVAADAFGLPTAIVGIGVVTIVSGLLFAVRFEDSRMNTRTLSSGARA